MTHFLRNEYLMKVLLAPLQTEKTAALGALGQYAFRVLSSATKVDVKEAVKLMFGVEVDSVSILSVKPKVKRVGRTQGKRKGWKKAYVTLSSGSSIDLELA